MKYPFFHSPFLSLAAPNHSFLTRSWRFFSKVLPTKAVAMVFRTDERAARKPKQPPTDFGTGDRGYSTSQVSL
jgi:hypothetical protein